MPSRRSTGKIDWKVCRWVGERGGKGLRNVRNLIADVPWAVFFSGEAEAMVIHHSFGHTKPPWVSECMMLHQCWVPCPEGAHPILGPWDTTQPISNAQIQAVADLESCFRAFCALRCTHGQVERKPRPTRPDDHLPAGLNRSESGLPCFRATAHVLTSQKVKDAETDIGERPIDQTQGTPAT